MPFCRDCSACSRVIFKPKLLVVSYYIIIVVKCLPTLVGILISFHFQAFLSLFISMTIRVYIQHIFQHICSSYYYLPTNHHLLGMVLCPLAQSQTVSRRTDGGETLPRISQPLPQVLKPLLEAINSEDVDNADEIALLWPVYYVNRVFKVWKQPPVLSLKLQQFRRFRSDLRDHVFLLFIF